MSSRDIRVCRNPNEKEKNSHLCLCVFLTRCLCGNLSVNTACGYLKGLKGRYPHLADNRRRPGFAFAAVFLQAAQAGFFLLIEAVNIFELRRVQRADHALSAAVQHVSVNHRRADVLMPQQVLHRTNVVSRRQQIRRKAVPQRVAGDRLDNPGRLRSSLNCFSNNGFVDVVPTFLTGPGVDGNGFCRENILPGP